MSAPNGGLLREHNMWLQCIRLGMSGGSVCAAEWHRSEVTACTGGLSKLVGARPRSGMEHVSRLQRVCSSNDICWLSAKLFGPHLLCSLKGSKRTSVFRLVCWKRNVGAVWNAGYFYWKIGATFDFCSAYVSQYV